MGERKTIAISVMGGMGQAGDPADAPEGVSQRLRNVEFLDDSHVGRPPFVSDITIAPVGPLLATVLGLWVWEDTASKTLRLVATVLQSLTDLYVKAASGEAWTKVADDFDNGGYNLASYASYRGIGYYTTWQVGGSSALRRFFSYDGTLPPVPDPIVPGVRPLIISTFNEREMLANLSVIVSNLLPQASVYDASSGWTLTTVSTTIITAGIARTCRITPTAGTGSKLELPDVATVAASTAIETHYQMLSALRGVDAGYRMPMTMEVFHSGPAWVATTAFVANAVVRPLVANGFRYVVTVAGTTGGSAPVWPTTAGTTVTDGSVTWRCVGSDAYVSQETEIANATDSSKATTNYLHVTVPPTPTAVSLGMRYKFGTTTTATVALVPVDFSFRDGLAETNPAKACFGQQLTLGSYFYPFVNQETAPSPGLFFKKTQDTPDVFAWTEVADPTTLLASAIYEVREFPGPITAAIVAALRYVVTKREAAWIFQGTRDANLPVAKERMLDNAGCVGPKAIDKWANSVFMIGDDEVYKIDLGAQPISVEPICGPAMKRAVLGHGSDWLENVVDLVGAPLQPILRVHPGKRQLWVATQKGTVFIYDLDRSRWSYFDFPAADGSFWAVRDMEYCRTTKRMEVVLETVGVTTGLVRQDETATGDLDSHGVSIPVTCASWLHPMESSPERVTTSVEEIGLHHKVTVFDTNDAVIVDLSVDGGVTFPYSKQITLSPLSTGGKVRTPVVLRGTGDTLTVRLRHVGKTGMAYWNILKSDAKVIVRGKEWSKARPAKKP